MTLITHRLTAARRRVYIYIIVITCLFVLHFKISQDFLWTPNFAPRCRSCVANFNVGMNAETDSTNGLFKMSPLGRSISINPSSQNERENNEVLQDGDNGGGEYKGKTVPKKDPINLRVKTVGGAKLNQTRVLAGEAKDKGVAADFKRGGSMTISSNVSANVLSGSGRLYRPPPNEKPVRRYPQCLIIGFAKCGTRALLEFLSLHPYVVSHDAEMHFYDRDEVFQRGFDWYRNQMPPSYSNQITIEKTPAYILYQRARDEIFKLTPDVKLILLVRDPVVRLVSQFLLRYREVFPHEDVPVTVIYRDKFTNQFNKDYKPVVIGIYYKHFAMWLERFPLKQFLILNSEHLATDPYRVLKTVETFLGIPAMLEERNFYFNESSGFFCPRRFEADAMPECLGKLKGVKHPKLPRDDEKMLYDFYRPLNEKFFRLAHQRFLWKEREWERYQ